MVLPFSARAGISCDRRGVLSIASLIEVCLMCTAYLPGQSLASMLVWFHYSHMILRPQYIRMLFLSGGRSWYASPLQSCSQWTTACRITICSAFLSEQSVLLSIASLYQQLFPAKAVAFRFLLLSAQLGLSGLCRSWAASLGLLYSIQTAKSETEVSSVSAVPSINENTLLVCHYLIFPWEFCGGEKSIVVKVHGLLAHRWMGIV